MWSVLKNLNHPFFFFFDQLFCSCPSYNFFYIFIWFFFFFLLHHTAYGILVLGWGLNPGPWQWDVESNQLTTREFLQYISKVILSSVFPAPLLCIFGYTLRPRVFISSPYISSLGESLFINWPTIVDCYCCLLIHSFFFFFLDRDSPLSINDFPHVS